MTTLTAQLESIQSTTDRAGKRNHKSMAGVKAMDTRAVSTQKEPWLLDWSMRRRRRWA
jgi:hypothetical protein